MDRFSTLLGLIEDGMTFTLTEKSCVPWDDFLIFSGTYPKQVITLHTKYAPYWVEFDGDEPMLLEDCPSSFFDTLIKNIKEGNYSVKR